MRPFRTIIYRWLGFRFERCQLPAAGAGMSSVMIFDVPWADRLRILVGGTVAVDALIMLDTPPKSIEVRSNLSVPEPGWRVPHADRKA